MRRLTLSVALCLLAAGCTPDTASTTEPPPSTASIGASSSVTSEPEAVPEPTSSTTTPVIASSPECVPAAILFIRGAPGTGGFVSGGADTHLSDVGDDSQDPGNTGWGTLAQVLQADGFTVSQSVENGNGLPEAFETFAVIVFGSNNADYTASDADRVETYVRSGGGALFISDANWGSDWDRAPSSDQAFLTRFDLVVNQDHGTYERTSADYLRDDHPILAGVSTFDGEGVSPFTIVDAVPDVQPLALVAAGPTIRRNVPGQGEVEGSTDADAALVAVDVERGRVVGHFDRNTFFNENGAGTSIARFDNERLAVNIFRWLARTDERPPCA